MATKARSLFCPSCEKAIPWEQIETDVPFRCPGCDAELCMPRSYSRFVVWGGIAIACMIGYLLGFRSDSLVVFVCVAFIPFSIVISILIRHRYPIELQLSDSYSMDLRGVGKRNS